MTPIRTFLIFMALVLPASLQAQDENPFVFSVQGGLFFPARLEHYSIYKSRSDLIWGVGGSVPIASGLFIAGDVSFFRSSALVNVTLDSVAKYRETFIHLGLIHKRQLANTVFIRFMVGLNRVHATETFASSQASEYTNESEQEIGYYGGVGVEQLLDNPHFSLYADLVYDYSRSYKKELSGDIGGLRLVVGVNLIMY